MTALLLAVLAGFGAAAAAWGWRQGRRGRAASERAEAYQKALQTTQDQLSSYVASLDNLMAMLQAIHEFSSRPTENATRRDLAKAIVDYACKLLRTHIGSLMLLDRSRNELVIVAAKGIPADVVAATRLKIGEGIAGIAAKEGRPIYVENSDRDPRFLRQENLEYPSKSFIAVPLKIRNKVVGVLNVHRAPEDPPFTERDVRLLTLLADQAAVTIENLELYENLQHLYLETMQTLARAIDAKDEYTREHADRASMYARLVAQELHLPESLVRHIEYAAMMHDIGKIGVPEHILRKPGRLTPEEYQEMKKHPAIGEQILSPIEFLAPIAPLVLYHHEWFDGSGYGEGLAGEEIPIGARIVAVIDAWDAMTSDRPYRKALPLEHAKAELRKGSGKQFDPRVVEAFLRVVERLEKQKEMSAEHRDQ